MVVPTTTNKTEMPTRRLRNEDIGFGWVDFELNGGTPIPRNFEKSIPLFYFA